MAAIDWEQMPYFLAIARAGSLRAAAEALGTTHGMVNRRLQALETAYGVRLFNRARRGLTLTRAGETLLPMAEEAETLFLGARRRLQGLDNQESGIVRFSLTGTMAYEIVSPILVEFFEAYPDIDLQILVSDRFEDIRRLATDVSLQFAHEVTEDMVARKFHPLALAPYASRSYLDRYLPEAGPNGEGLHWIGWDEAERHLPWVDDSAFPAAEIRHATTDHVLQISLARHGFGMVSTVPHFAAIYPELIPVPGATPQLDRNLWILLHSDLRRTTRVRRFIDFLAAGLKALRPSLQGALA